MRSGRCPSQHRPFQEIEKTSPALLKSDYIQNNRDRNVDKMTNGLRGSLLNLSMAPLVLIQGA
jgi:hypothetical protein